MMNSTAREKGKWMERAAAWFCAAALLAGLAACQSEEKGDDLNDTIPKLINSWKGPNNVQAATDLFNATSPDARRIAIATISKKKWGHEEPYMKAYRMLATDPEPLVRGQALRALGTSKRADVADVLLKGLTDPNPMVRRDAVAAIMDIHSNAVVDALLDHLKTDTDGQVRILCAKALKDYPGPRMLRGLASALDDRDAAVVDAAHLGLMSTTGKDLGAEPGPWLAWIAAQEPPTTNSK